MTGRLDGRTAIVTGASRGLGRAIALALAAEGAAVAVVARTEQVWNDKLPGTIGETVAEIEAAGGRAVAIRADLTDRDDIVGLVDEARAALGPITVLVNNAAFTAPGRPPRPDAAPKTPKPAGAPKAANADWPGFLSVPLSAYRRHFELWKATAQKHGIALARVSAEADFQKALQLEGIPSGAVETA